MNIQDNEDDDQLRDVGRPLPPPSLASEKDRNLSKKPLPSPSLASEDGNPRKALPPPSLASEHDNTTITTNYTFPHQAPIPPVIHRALSKDSAYMSEMTGVVMSGNPWPAGEYDAYVDARAQPGYEGEEQDESTIPPPPPPPPTMSQLEEGVESSTPTKHNTRPPVVENSDDKDTEEPSTATGTTGKYYEINFTHGDAQVQSKKGSPRRSPGGEEGFRKSPKTPEEKKEDPIIRAVNERDIANRYYHDDEESGLDDDHGHENFDQEAWQDRSVGSTLTGPTIPLPIPMQSPTQVRLRQQQPTDYNPGEQSMAGYSAGVSEGYTNRQTVSSEASSIFYGPLGTQIRGPQPSPTGSNFLPPGSIRRTYSNESKLPQLSVADKSAVTAPKTLFKPKRVKLMEGRFSLDDGSTRRFVYVPANYSFRSKENFDAVLQALGIPKPELAFQIGDCFSVVPNMNSNEIAAYYNTLRPRNYEGSPQKWIEREDLKFPHPSRDYFEILTRHNRVRSVLDSIASSCSSAASSTFIINAPHRGNELAEFAIDAAHKNGIASLGLFHDSEFTCLIGDSSLDDTQFEQVDMNQIVQREFQVPWDRYWSKRRQKVPREFFHERDFVTDVNEDPNETMQIHCQRTPAEKAFQENYRYNIIKNGLADSCSHVLVFESKEAKKEFYKLYTKVYSAGMIVAGSTTWTLDQAWKCIQQARPIFILENTGATSNAVANLVRFGSKVEDFRIAGARLDSPKFVDPLAVESYIEAHFPPYDGKSELAMDDNIWEYAKVIAQNFLGSAPNFNIIANGIIDIGSYCDANSISDDVSRVVNSTSERAPELGGPAKDLQALGKARAMMNELARAKRRYRFGGIFMQTLVRGMVILAVASGVVLSVQVTKESNKKAHQTFQFFSIMLPLMASVMITLEATIRPSLKRSLLLLAEKRIESEMYRFRTRTGMYRAKSSSSDPDTMRGSKIRTKFMENCEAIIESCFESDVGTGSLFGMTTRKDDIAGLFRSDRAGNQSSAWPREAVQTIVNRRARDDGWSNERMRVKSWSIFKKPAPRTNGNLAPVDYNPDQRKARGGSSVGTDSEYSPVGSATAHETTLVSASDYLEKRIVDQLSELHGDAPYLASLRMYLKLCTIVLTASASALASFDLAEWIPLPLIVAMAFEFAKDYMQLDTRVPTINGAAGELIKVWLWWTGLSAAQTRLASNKDILVDRSERAILAQFEHHAGQVVSALRRNQIQTQEVESRSKSSPRRSERERQRFHDISGERNVFDANIV